MPNVLLFSHKNAFDHALDPCVEFGIWNCSHCVRPPMRPARLSVLVIAFGRISGARPVGLCVFPISVPSALARPLPSPWWLAGPPKRLLKKRLSLQRGPMPAYGVKGTLYATPTTRPRGPPVDLRNSFLSRRHMERAAPMSRTAGSANHGLYS